ncbi:MAG: toprim domain-containing protein [Pseudomonadota bacterium]
MQNREYEARIEAVKQRAHGRWTEILASLGVDERILKRRNLPCPLCGGTDRFQYTDKFGEGNYHCRSCGPGGGFKLLQAVLGIDFNTALRDVERCLGMMPAMVPVRANEPSAERMQKLAQRIWSEAMPVTAGDEVDRYLTSRGVALPVYPKVLRFHPALGYYQKDADGKSHMVAEYPAMLACIQGEDGHAVTLHRTYLQDGTKLAVPDAKKVLSSGINGAAVRLFEATEELGISEGIEKSIALYLATGRPFWAGLNAGNLEKLWIPDSVRRVWIYADNDADGDFAGQAGAFVLARRLKREAHRTGSRDVQVFVPKDAGVDWSDLWLRRVQALSAQAA